MIAYSNYHKRPKPPCLGTGPPQSITLINPFSRSCQLLMYYSSTLSTSICDSTHSSQQHRLYHCTKRLPGGPFLQPVSRQRRYHVERFTSTRPSLKTDDRYDLVGKLMRQRLESSCCDPLKRPMTQSIHLDSMASTTTPQTMPT